MNTESSGQQLSADCRNSTTLALALLYCARCHGERRGGGEGEEGRGREGEGGKGRKEGGREGEEGGREREMRALLVKASKEYVTYEINFLS